MLKIRNLNTYYGAIHALKGIDLDVPEGKIVTLVGSNGAGKSTTVLSATGIFKVAEGSVIELNGENIANMGPHKIVKRGVSLSPEGREVFPSLTMEENLRLGAFPVRNQKKMISDGYERVCQLFPRLKERLKQEEQGLAAFGYLWNDGTTAADRLLHGAERLMYQEKQQHYRDSTRRVQECPGYAQALYKRYRQREEKEE